MVITDSKHGLPIADHLLEQSFVATKPSEVWLADIAYILTNKGWLCLATILELFSRKVVGWAMRDHLRQELTIAALTMAIQRQRPARGLIHHADRGSQYASGDDRVLLNANGIVPSKNRKGNCWEQTVPRHRFEWRRERADGERVSHTEDRTRPSHALHQS